MAWRDLLAKMLLVYPARVGVEPGQLRQRFLSRRLHYPELALSEQLPPLPPYDALAALYHAYAAPQQPNYGAYLAEQMPGIQRVLDLACGSGTNVLNLAAVVPEVVGLDRSETMLAEARRRGAQLPGVRFTAGDLRDFALEETFDAAVCGANSMNYLLDRVELNAVLRRVAAHLKPGGRFIFDTITDRGMRGLAGRYMHLEVGEGEPVRFAIAFRYDQATRRERSVVLLPHGHEVHERLAIDPADVSEASRDSGLSLVEAFSIPFLPARWYLGWRCFYVLER